jgi:hypothetical protein
MRDFAREEKIIAMFRGGLTMQKIGDHFDITRQRVQQILWRRGIVRADGGAKTRVKIKSLKAIADRDAHWIKKTGGLTFEQKRHLAQIGATRVFSHQRCNARHRGISWNLTLAEWWKVWELSGKWEQRGRRADGYCMSRILDTGGYEVGNVHIQTLSENSREATKIWIGQKKKLPRGVFDAYPGLPHMRYRVVANRKCLGYFASPEAAAEARAAFLIAA